MGIKNQNESGITQTPHDQKCDSSKRSASATATTLGIDDSSAEISVDVEKGFHNADQSPDRNEHSNIVNWDGLNDPDLPLDWPATKKWTTILLLATLTLLTPFASSMFAPSVEMVIQEFHSGNATIGTLVVSIYLLGYAFGPLFIDPLSEMFGRLPVYHCSTILFILFNIACAKSTNFPMLIVFRVLTGIAGSGPLTLGPGSISDLYRQEERGKIIAIWTLPILLGPTIGPIAGGYLSESLGWRWDFWFLVIVTGAVFVLSILLQPLKPPRLSTQTFLTSIIRPTKMLVFSPIILGLSVVTAIIYGVIYLLFTTLPTVFEENYNISSSNVGLTYLGLGGGQLIGVLGFGFFSDRMLRRLAKDGEMKPEFRLPPLLVGVCLTSIGLLWYGWSAKYAHQWIVPILGQVVVGAGVITSFLPVSAYLVDAFTQYAASANAANTVLRSLGGALLPLAGPKMYDALGQGWENTLLAGIVFCCVPLVLVIVKYGEIIRKSPRFQMNL